MRQDTLQKIYAVLAVDADPAQHVRMREYAGEFFKIEAALSGNEALNRIYKGFRPDLVMLDAYASHMGDWDAFNRIRAICRLKNIPIVVVGEKKAFDLSADSYLAKPFGKEKFIETLSSLLK
jgi:CheY-like chemotaxis protein